MMAMAVLENWILTWQMWSLILEKKKKKSTEVGDTALNRN